MAIAPPTPIGRSTTSTVASRPFGRELRRFLEHSLGQLREEVVVRGRLLSRARGGPRRAVGFIEERDFRVAVIVRLAAAEFSQAQHDQPACFALERPRPQRRLAMFLHEPCIFALDDVVQTELGDVGQGGVRRVDRSLPRISRTPIRRWAEFFRSCRIGSTSSAPRDSSASVRSSSSRVGSRSSWSESTRSSIMPGLVVRMPDKYGLAAHSRT